jgi:fructose-1,6-bisphosphatase/inositol monophosphatase family enzyme/predicted metal-dependent phosphoesterase TrpH
MKADFHIHTDISDGYNNIKEIMKMAKQNDLTHIAITNHDTIEGLEEAIKLGKKEGIKVIPGIEISAFNFEKDKKVHILGFNFDLEGKNIKKLCDPILQKRNANSILHIVNLIQNGYKISIKNIINRARDSGVIYKQHIMDELIEKGYTNEIYSELYKELFKKDGICSNDIIYVDAVDAVKAIKLDGGVAVLAHPGQLNSYDIIDRLVNVGLDGLELNHEDHSPKDIEIINEYSNKYNLFLTGGSDFHGKYGSEISLGCITSPKEVIKVLDKKFDEDTPEAIENFIKSIVSQAGEFIRKPIVENMNLKLKNNDFKDIVTKHDIEIEKFLVKKISERYPEHSFITEEKTSSKQFFSEYTWIIDPIDGTTNFVNFHKDFAISVALYKDKKPYIGVVYDVVKDLMYSAISGKMAMLNGTQITKPANEELKLEDSIIDFSLNSITNLRNNKIDLTKINDSIRGHRSYGSASLAICKIATGELQGYISSKLKIWDFAAAVILLEALRGCYEYFSCNNEAFLALDDKVIFIAAENKQIKNELLNKLNFPLSINRINNIK